MQKITVQVRDDHLELLSRAKPMTAIAELIWNALDAESTEVHIEFPENPLGGLDCIRIRDNGHGLAYEHAMIAFRNLGGSWKRELDHTTNRKRPLHGQYGKGRFRAFTLGNHVQWTTVFATNGQRKAYSITGRAQTLGEFELTDPEPTDLPLTGLTVEIGNLGANVELLRGGKALQEVTDTFALYLKQYPDVRIVYDGVPLDPANSEDRSTEYDLGELVMQNGERVRMAMTVVEWNIPGHRGVILCDPNGFALHTLSWRLYFRGFSYTVYLKSPHFVTLEKQGLLDVEEMAPDIKQLLEEVRVRMRQHFSLREAERAQDVLVLWRETGLYPYAGEPADLDEETERRIFDIYGTHLNQLGLFSQAAYSNKRLMLRLMQELVALEPVRVARILDELLAFPDDKQEAVEDLLHA